MTLYSVSPTYLTNSLIKALADFRLIEMNVFRNDGVPKAKLGIRRENPHAIRKDVWLWRNKQGDNGSRGVSMHQEIAVTGDRFAAKVIIYVASRIGRNP